jgi:UDP:flavonoid glycosyltransferase YjiC (YdhE family)
MSQNIGFISFIPDGGHVLPLLRMAVAFMENKYNVTCYFPEESLKYASSFDIPIKSIGKVTNGIDKEVFARLSKRSIFYNFFSYYLDLGKGYFQPIQLTIAEKTEYLKELLIRDNLSLIITDSNCCNAWYMLFAILTKIPLVIHLSEGNCRYWQRPFISAYGITNHSPLTQTIIEIAGNCFQQWYRQLSLFKTNKIYKNIVLLVEKAFSSINTEPVSPIYISSGLGFIEREKIRKGLNKIEDQLLVPPISDRRMAKIPQMLQDWFDRGGKKPVVYVCLGTMVRGQKRLFKKIIRGLKDFDINILWSAPDDQVLVLEEIGIPPNLRIEEFVPQSQVLALEEVRCFITHGGAGGVQECLLSGKPMLCIPFMFDQPYNSSIVELLQVGIKLWKNKVSSRSIKNSVAQLLYNQEYSDAAQGIMKKLRAQDGGEAIIQHMQKIGILQ